MDATAEHWITYRAWESEQHHDRYYDSIPNPPNSPEVRMTLRADRLLRALFVKHGVDNWYQQ